MNLLTTIFLIFVIGFLTVGAELAKVDMEKGIERDIYNFTEEKLIIPDINLTAPDINRTRGEINTGRIYPILDTYITFIMTFVIQVSKMGIEYGYENPHINWESIMKFIFWILIIYVVVLLIKPVGYVFIFLILFIMWIKDWYVKRRKRKKHDK